MTPEELAAKKKARDAKRNEGKPCKECAAVQPDHAATCSLYVAPVAKDASGDLGDAEVQAAILSPKPFPVTFGGEASQMYPLPANERCEVAWEFWPSVIGAAREIGPLPMNDETPAGEKLVLLIGRCARALVRNANLKAQFVRFVARSEFAPDADPDDSLLEARAKLIDRTTEPEELFAALSRFYVTEVVGPKAMAQPK
ncbi:MAG: hypothetical protein JWM87_740 [Candidatus Eremiobacteraeota bacterium]|nr:hypothetical protein [Candidatus Eremiobacteraeota bacterium]